MTSQLPQETLRQLCGIFPSFAHEWAREHAPAEDGFVDGVYYEWTHHGVLRPFLEYFANSQQMSPEAQIRALALWINSAVAVDGELENAVSTCFLEHMRQVHINRLLWAHLCSRARAKSHA